MSLSTIDASQEQTIFGFKSMISICIISTYLNHHNKPLCDALFELNKGNFWYIATSRISEWRRQMGFNELDAEYLLDYTIVSERKRIHDVVNNAAVVIIGASEPISIIKERLNHQGKITFRCSERLFKTNSRYLKAPIHWYRSLQSRQCYMLCCSALTARDYSILGFYRNRCFKWGYFTEVKSLDPRVMWDRKIKQRNDSSCVSILWVSRLVDFKHPDVAIKALKKVRDAGFSFDFKLIGDGPEAPKIKALINSLGLSDCVHLLGAKSTIDVRVCMEESEIFLFTSNREEGWGAVLNESMSCACSVIANSQIGSVPFLINNGENGLVYHNNSVEELAECLKRLLGSDSYREALGIKAYRTIADNWSPRKAASNLIALSEALLAGKQTPFESGPCSQAK